MPAVAGSMLGTCRWTAEGKAVFRELLLLEETPDGLVMTVSHVGPRTAKLEEEPESVKLEKLTDEDAVFVGEKAENPARITYRREPDGGLYARVDTHRNGQPPTLEFPMKPAK